MFPDDVPFKAKYRKLTRKACNVHFGKIAGLEDDHSETVGGGLVAQWYQQLPTTMTVNLQWQNRMKWSRFGPGSRDTTIAQIWEYYATESKDISLQCLVHVV